MAQKYSWPLPGEGTTAEELALAEIRTAIPGVATYSGQARRDAALAELIATAYNGFGSKVLYQNQNLTTTSGSEVSLASFPLPTTVLTSNGQALRLTIMGLAQTGMTSFQVRCKFGATYVLSYAGGGVATGHGAVFKTVIDLVRTGSTTQAAVAITLGVDLTIAAQAYGAERDLPGETLPGTPLIDFRAIADGTRTLTYDLVQVEYLAA